MTWKKFHIFPPHPLSADKPEGGTAELTSVARRARRGTTRSNNPAGGSCRHKLRSDNCVLVTQPGVKNKVPSRYSLTHLGSQAFESRSTLRHFYEVSPSLFFFF